MQLTNVRENIVNQIEGGLGGSKYDRSFIAVLSSAIAGAVTLLYKYAGYVHLQQFVAYADYNTTNINGKSVRPLVEWGRLVGVSDPNPPTHSVYKLEIYHETGAPDTLVNKYTRFVSGGGDVYQATSSAWVTAGEPKATIIVRSLQAGAGFNLAPGTDKLRLSSPLEGVSRDASVVSEESRGVDEESEGAYRQRVLDRFQKRPQGGAYADYEQWGEEVPGVTNVYPYTSGCPGQVDVYVETASGAPTEAQLKAVVDSINYNIDGKASRRPAGALVNVYPVEYVIFDVAITGLEVAEVGQVKARIKDEVRSYIESREPFITGLTIPPRNDRITPTAVAGVVDKITSASAGIFSAAILRVNDTPVSIHTLGVGQKAKLGALEFIDD